MIKALLGATVAIAFTAFAFTGTAQAQCWWTKGYNLQCSYPSASGSAYYVPQPAYVPPPAYSPVWSGGYPNYIYPDTGTYPPYWVMQR